MDGSIDQTFNLHVEDRRNLESVAFTKALAYDTLRAHMYNMEKDHGH